MSHTRSRSLSASLSVLVALVLLGSIDEAVAQSKITAMVGGTLIDGYGGPPIRNSVILIDGERISDVGHVGGLEIPDGAEIISTEGMSVLPGLWDMHVHLMINGHSDYVHWDKTYPPVFESVIMPASALQLLLAGVTSARDLGAPLDDSIAVRGDVLRYINLLQSVDIVVKHGHRYK
jgi:imidazolonepropionase-like amidohydrolase